MSNGTGGHWYTKEGVPMHFVTKADGVGQRNATLADARKLGLVPGVSGILKVLDKPALLQWKIKQAVMAVMTSPRQPGEPDDAFVERVLNTEGQHEQEAAMARDRGQDIHDAMEALLHGKPITDEIGPWVVPAYLELKRRLEPYPDHQTERVLVGGGYAGRSDLVAKAPEGQPRQALLVDYKSTKSIPKKESWDEHQLQLAAYAHALRLTDGIPLSNITTANLYISTVEPGKFAWFDNPDTASTLAVFLCLQAVWCWINDYDPR